MPEETAFKPLEKPKPEGVDWPVNAEGNTYLHELCQRDAPLSLIREAILDLGANVNALNKKNMPPLAMAIQHGRDELIQELVNLGAALYFPVSKEKHFNAAIIGVYSGRETSLRAVIAAGAGSYVNETGVYPDGKDAGENCMMTAVMKKHNGLVPVLVAAGAFIDAESGSEHLSPLQYAARANDYGAIRMLVSQGAVADCAQSGSGMTALHYATMAGQCTAVDLLLEFGSNPDHVNKAGRTALMIASAEGNVSIAKTLLTAGANPDVVSPETGETALIQAANKGKKDVADALLRAGANPMIADRFNKTAARHADDNRHPDISNALGLAEETFRQRDFEQAYRKYRP